MTIDSGELYVADRGSAGEPRLDKFNASTGSFIAQFPQVPSLSYLYQGVAVGHSTGETEVYIGADKVHTEEGAMAVFISAGALQATWEGKDTPAKGFGCFNCGDESKGGVAVDNSGNPLTNGDVYVSAPEQGVVDVFEPKAGGGERYVTQLTGPEPGVAFKKGPVGAVAVGDVAVDQLNGDVLVVEEQEAVDVFEPTVLGYTLVQRPAGTPGGAFERVSGVAVDGSNGDIYVTDYGKGVVDQFSSAGVYLGELSGTGTPTGAFGEIDGVAVDPATQDVYVNAREGAHFVVDVFGRNIVIPDVTTAPVSNVKARSAGLNGTVNPDGAGQATCRFEWGTSEAFGNVTACVQTGIEGNTPVKVSAAISGLLPDTTYYYRLQASNANGTNHGDASQDQHFTTAGPGIHEPSASSVTSTSATLDAGIDPNNASTSYYFEYGTSASYGSSVPVPPGAGLGSGEGTLSVSVHLQGLSPGAVYHYRVVAVSEPGGESVTVESPDETFTTQGAGSEVSLPDGRFYEMVSPPNKQGAGIYPVGRVQGGDVQAAAGGGGITYEANAAFVTNPAGNRAIESTPEISTRHAPGSWETADITTPHNEGAGEISLLDSTEYLIFSSDLSVGLVNPPGDTPLPPLPPGSEKTVYLREANGEYRALVTAANVPEGTKFGGERENRGGVEIVSASPDLNHVVLAGEVPLVEGAPSSNGLYEWSAGKPASEPLRLVSILPPREGKPEEPTEAILGSSGASITGLHSGQSVTHAISDDGSRVIWSNIKSHRGQKISHLYMRDMAREETVQLDAAQEGLREPPEGAQTQFRTANGEGSRVFFTSPERLTANSKAPLAGREGYGAEDLYEFELTSSADEPLKGRLTDLTVPANAGEAAAVGGVVGASEDGSYVYFVALGVLGDGGAHGAKNGGENLYVEHYDEAAKAWLAPSFIASGAEGIDVPKMRELSARVSPNGRWLAFMSKQSLTGYDNRDAVSGVPDEEVFLYHAPEDLESESGSHPPSLACASCDPTGARPVGLVGADSGGGGPLVDPGETWGTSSLAGNVPAWEGTGLGYAVYQPRYLSDSGRLFFDSSNALVPADVNGKEDVYEYEPEGVPAGEHACSPSSTDASDVFEPAGTFAVDGHEGEAGAGCVALISSGTSAQESAFLDASETGGDVFFLTTSQLSPQDYDNNFDIYDAHECTSEAPCAPPAALTPPPCETEASCKTAPTPQPEIYGAPSSETFSGQGNIVQPNPPAPPKKVTKKKTVKCAKSKRLSHGKCVKIKTRAKRARKASNDRRASR